MRLVDFLDKGASVHPIDAPFLTMAGQARSYADGQRLSWSVGRALARSGVSPGVPGKESLCRAQTLGPAAGHRPTAERPPEVSPQAAT